MTRITFLGTGEAFDPDRTTTSYLIQNSQGCIMVDCGYDASKSLMRFLKKRNQSLADVPDVLLLTHEHGDHFGGIPALLMPIWEEVNGIVGNRKNGIGRKITIASAHSYLLDRVQETMEGDYKGFFERFKREGPDISLKVINRDGDKLLGYDITAAETSHGARNFAYRFQITGENSFAISGDGAFTDNSQKLYRGVGFLIHEGFNVMGSGGKNHASIEQVVDYAIAEGIPKVAIVHVNREERNKVESVRTLKQRAREKGVEVFLPDDHDTFNP